MLRNGNEASCLLTAYKPQRRRKKNRLWGTVEVNVGGGIWGDIQEDADSKRSFFFLSLCGNSWSIMCIRTCSVNQASKLQNAHTLMKTWIHFIIQSEDERIVELNTIRALSLPFLPQWSLVVSQLKCPCGPKSIFPLNHSKIIKEKPL